MDEHSSAPAPVPLSARWHALSTPGKFVLGIIFVVGAFIIVTMLRTMLSQTFGLYGMDSASIEYAGYGGGVSAPAYEMGMANMKASSRVAMDYDDAYYPTPYPTPGGTGGYEEADYETRNFSVYIKTREYDAACGALESWKPYTHIIFESANRGDSRCSYTFKVERKSVDTVIADLKKLDPRDFNEQTDVVKRQLTQYTSALEVLQKREELLTSTLNTVTAAYDELVALSKQAQDVETLAKVIDGKLNYIERLSQQRLQVASELEEIARSKADLTDRIEYVYFNVSVEKVEFIDGEQLKDSWVSAVRTFVYDLNETFALVLWLIAFLLKAVVLFVVMLVVAKVGWRATKHFWQA